jgi:hypothetical protein
MSSRIEAGRSVVGRKTAWQPRRVFIARRIALGAGHAGATTTAGVRAGKGWSGWFSQTHPSASKMMPPRYSDRRFKLRQPTHELDEVMIPKGLVLKCANPGGEKPDSGHLRMVAGDSSRRTHDSPGPHKCLSPAGRDFLNAFLPICLAQCEPDPEPCAWLPYRCTHVAVTR